MLSPKRTKYRKPHRGNINGGHPRRTAIVFGEYGLQAKQATWITARQIEARRRVLTRYVRRNGKLWLRIFPDKPITRRPPETRIGSGKGAVEYWVAVVRSGTILFELQGIPEDIALRAINIAASKLPVKTQFITRTLPSLDSRIHAQKFNNSLHLIVYMAQDRISGIVTSIKNALQVRRPAVILPNSRVIKTLCQLLLEEGLISDVSESFSVLNGQHKNKCLFLHLKYTRGQGNPTITNMQRISRPGLRIYTNRKKIPKIFGGVGLVILSTSKGFITDRTARNKKNWG